ncbi:MAG: glycerate kinase type-2 family protein [Desulfobaccales bacterium]
MDQKTKEVLTTIFRAGLRAVDPAAAVRRHVALVGSRLRVGERFYPLEHFQRIIVTGAGKGTAPMAQALEEILGDRLTTGWIIVKYGHGLPLKKIRVMEAGHPVPDAAGLDATRFILDRLREGTAADLVLCAFSGGGSALTPAPLPRLDFSEKQQTTQLLLASGASIDEVNALRKHISAVKGGRLAEIAAPATVVSLLLSDVIGDRLDIIASGPTAPDPSTYQEVLGIIARYGLGERIPPRVREIIVQGAQGLIPETPKPGNPVFRHVHNLIIGSNSLALAWAKEVAERLGYETRVISTTLSGEAAAVARGLALRAREIKETLAPGRKVCLLSGGETTVTVKGAGRGGRNTELALAFAVEIGGTEKISLLAAGTDGTDGPTDAAGALADGRTVARALSLGLDPGHSLADNDSYTFFEKLDDLVITGPTGTNVMDLQLILIEA